MWTIKCHLKSGTNVSVDGVNQETADKLKLGDWAKYPLLSLKDGERELIIMTGQIVWVSIIPDEKVAQETK